MLNISAENIEHSFLEVDKGMTHAGTKALDRYVMDDGWNDYSKGFWSFNDKFPNEAYKLTILQSHLVHRLDYGSAQEADTQTIHRSLQSRLKKAATVILVYTLGTLTLQAKNT